MKEKGKPQFKNNASVTAFKNEKGFIILSLYIDGVLDDSVNIKLEDYGGKDKAKVRKLSYKIYCALNGK